MGAEAEEERSGELILVPAPSALVLSSSAAAPMQPASPAQPYLISVCKSCVSMF